MAQPDFRGARGSNAGDDFHELWAVRQALALLDTEAELRGMAVEGLRAEDEHGVPADMWDGVDCALYFNGDTVSSASRIDLIQFKYSSADPDKSWTLSRLTTTSAKTMDNSVLRRLGNAFAAARDKRGGSAAGIFVRLISNQAVSPDVEVLFKAIAADAKPSVTEADLKSVEKATNLNGEALQQFSAALSFPETGSRFAIENNVLSTLASWTESDARTVLNNLLAYIGRMMLPEGKGQWLTRETLLAEFGFSVAAALYPCPPPLSKVAQVVPRSASASVIDEMRNGRQYMCLHGLAGCGKTTTLHEIETLLPAGSHMIVFDCYGGGRYLDSDAYRHRPKDAFLQLANELASKLRVPLLLTRSDGVDYPRVFHGRLRQAAEALKAAEPDALLVIVVDAADNSVTAARHMVPAERSFVQDVITFGNLPDSVRLVVTARTGRLGDLQLPQQFIRVAIGGFSRDETAQHVRSFWPSASDSWIDDFHFHSHGNPRVQRYALQQNAGNPGAALDLLLPGGRTLSDVFQIQLEEARKKAGRNEPLDGFAAALSILPHPAPATEVAAISGLTEAEVADICVDLAPGIRAADEGIGFADEDFEDFIRTISASQLPNVRLRVAERFLQRHDFDQYAAMRLAAGLYAAGRGKEVLNIIETEIQPKIVKDPILRREIGFHRLQTAMQVSAESSDEASMLRTILVGAEAMHGADTTLELIIKNPDLAATLMEASAVRGLLLDSRQIAHHGRLLFHLMLQDARKGNAIGARAKHRQLDAWLQKRRLELDQQKKERHYPRSEEWLITDGDIAAEFETALRLAGPSQAIGLLSRWRPREIALKSARLAAERLLVSGRSDLVHACLADHAVKDPWSLFLLVPLALAGHKTDLKRLERSLLRIHRRHWIDLEKLGNTWEEDTFPKLWLETILTGCEILIAQGSGDKAILPLLEVFADPAHRKIDHLFTSKTTLIAMQLRATALLAHIAKRPLTLEEFLVTPKDDPKEPDSARDSNSRHREELRRFVRPLIALYDTRARILLGEIPASEWAATVASTTAPVNDYDYSRMHEAFEMRRKAVIDLTLLRCVPGIDPQELLTTCLGLLSARPGYLGADELAVLPAFAPYPQSHDTILKTTSYRATAIIAERTLASEKTDVLLRICRLIRDISRDEGAALFAEAHRMSEEIDVDAIYQLRALASLAIQSVTSLDQANRRAACQRLHSVTTDAAVRLSNNEGFPWDVVVDAMVKLDIPFALAAISRWQDSHLQDLDTTFPPFIQAALHLKAVTAEGAVALLPMISRARDNFLGDIANACITSNAQAQVQAVDLFAKDILLRYGGSHEADVVKALNDWNTGRGGAPRPWLQGLSEAAAFISKHKPKTSHSEFNGHTRHIVFEPGQRFTSSDEILQAVNATAGKGDHHLVPSAILEQMRDAVPAADRVAYLNGLAGIRPSDISDYVIAEAIFEAVEQPAWRDLAGIRHWCTTHLPEIIVQRLLGFAHGFGYGGRPPLPPLLRRLANENVNIPSLLARAIGAHVDGLSASVVYELSRLMVEHTQAGWAAAALQSYLDRVCRRIPAKDLDEIDPAQVPQQRDIGIARFFFALMSDCDVRLRWRAAHCVRRLAALGLTDWFDAWVNRYDTKEEIAYRAAGEPFYWLAARLWSVIVFDRVALETPNALVAHTSKIVSIAEDDSLPHVLIRAFARDAALYLLKSGHLKMSAKDRKRLTATNTSPVPRQKAKNRHSPRSSGEKKRDFDFDQMDTVPYWYERAIDVFADVSMDEFLDVAERWIVKEWRVVSGSSRWDLQPRKYRFSDRDWVQSSNDHGSEPILERYSTYLERHAMFCAVGELMRTRALSTSTPDADARMESWRSERGLASPPVWLADLRCSKPLERQFWFEPDDVPQWVKKTPDDEFLNEIGWSGKSEAITVHAWHETGSSSFSSRVYVASALVATATASSLMRALQASRDPYDYRLPDVGEEFEIDSPPYRLLGWLEDFSITSGVDSLDPFSATVGGVTIKPGRAVATGLDESVTDQGGVVWSGPKSSVPFRYIIWSNKRNDIRNEQRRHGLETEGNRLVASTDVLKSYLRKTGMDLIVSVKILKEEGDGGYQKAGAEKTKARTAKVLILRKDGTVEDDKGHLGAW